jgi:hypothetical protein
MEITSHPASLSPPAIGHHDGMSVDDLLSGEAAKIIDAVINRRCRAWKEGRSFREDIRSEVMLRLLGHLRKLDEMEAAPVESFRDYVAVVTRHVVDDFTRRLHPRRTQLKNRIWYVLRHDPRFETAATGTTDTICRLRDSQQVAERVGHRMKHPSRHSSKFEALAGEVATALRAAGDCELDQLVALVARAKGLTDDQTRYEGERALDNRLEYVDDRIESIDRAATLRLLWQEIALLSFRQRTALLLSLRDENGDSVLSVLPLLGIATIRELAEAVSIDADAFALLWNRLPLPDDDIGERLGVTRQQVINLRKAARDRLTRRVRRSGTT